jgi:hypothetical protein
MYKLRLTLQQAPPRLAPRQRFRDVTGVSNAGLLRRTASGARRERAPRALVPLSRDTSS